MRLEQLEIGTVARAVGIYLDEAYGGGARPGRLPDLSLDPDADWSEVLGLFQKEEANEGSSRKTTRYSFRLGNRNYPFMKLVLQEHLVAGQYYFLVDTHDEMDIKPDYPDYEAWMAVRRFNQGLKRRIEDSLTAAGLHTAASLCSATVREPAVDCVPSHHILVVDDEEHIADAVENLLRAKGYAVSVEHDGGTALTRARDCLPDLILLDYELPEMDGLEVIAALRADPATKSIPVLLATAGHIALDDIQKADGFLAKPFPEALLYELVDRLLGTKRASTEQA
ncbi:MAG: response regulator [Planctomycetota bacterium]